MKKLSKMLLGAVACMMLVVCVPMISKAAPLVPQSVNMSTVYYSQSFHIGDLKKGTKITAVKSSNPAVAEVLDVEMRHEISESNHSNENYNGYRSESYYALIEVRINKVGTTTISYKINDKKYTTKVNVKAYKNPIDTIKVTGVKSGKNFAGSYNQTTWNNFKLGKDISDVKLTLKLKSGYKVNYAYGRNEVKGTSVNYNFPLKSSVSLSFGKFKKSEKGYLSFDVYDVKNSIYMYMGINLNYN